MSRVCLLSLAALLVCARAFAVSDSERTPAGMVDDENATTEWFGELGKPLNVSCLASEPRDPTLFMAWYRGPGKTRLLFRNPKFEQRTNVLHIKNLSIETLGQYTCQAFNAIEMKAPRMHVVRAFIPDGLIIENPWLVRRSTEVPQSQLFTTKKTTLFTERELTGRVVPRVTVSPKVQPVGVVVETIAADNTTTQTKQFSEPEFISRVVPRITVAPKTQLTATLGPKSQLPATLDPKAQIPTTLGTETLLPATLDPKTQKPATLGTSTQLFGALGTSTQLPATLSPNTPLPATLGTETRLPASLDPKTQIPATLGTLPTTLSPNTQLPATLGPNTQLPATLGPNTQLPATLGPNTQLPATLGPNTQLPATLEQIAVHISTTTQVSEQFTEASTLSIDTTATTIETTESSETSERSTTYDDTTDVTGTTTLDPCAGFQFGCCADNETKATGPDQHGCPCNTTELDCRVGGVSPDIANNIRPVFCNTSLHGCCQDNKTSAHGPDFEGCCLLQAFGCCLDNRKPAEGPHLEGCGCQYARHGCCPDNVTIAQGPDNQGCGCEYTQHGCCPDRHTAASGSNNEGCTCKTYQFGCCADGVTFAEGPDQQGCYCYQSKFGCCGDGETHATGPDAAGCDCSSSRHGCCPDGRTESAGPNFLGCTDAPENKQAACSMSTDAGLCRDFTAMWFYDMAYGGCSRFWYGGCDGNGNRFGTKEECEDVCVQPPPRDSCRLPSVKGACDTSYQRWYFNSTREQCIPFEYGGCLGNANNFETRELCQKQCEPSSGADQCNLPIDQGSCSGNYSRWGFNSETHQCQQFIWGGCEGNSNRFSSEAACQMRCADTQPPQCIQPQDAGNCTEKEALWSFSQSENRCLPFYYSGCGGNDNRFSSRETCAQTCPSAYEPDKCTLPAVIGDCSNYTDRWFFDTTYKRCRQFSYGGCGGNENNFVTEAECENSCLERTTTTTTKPTVIKPHPGQKPNIPAAPESSDVCQLPMRQGPCDESLMRWFYNPGTESCSQFTYGGCDGNDNRFESHEACEKRCKIEPAPIAPATPSTIVTVKRAGLQCKTPSSLEPCGNSVPVYYYNSESAQCLVSNIFDCGYLNTYKTEEECERTCGAFLGKDVCGAHLDEGPCRESIPKFYWDAITGSCQNYTYGGCGGGPNRFSSIGECMYVCGTGPNPYEVPQPDCTRYRQECEALTDCPYGIGYMQDGCERCACVEDPCLGVNCSSSERCEVFGTTKSNAFRKSEYSARCVAVEEEPAPPLALPQQEPEVTASEGGTAVLRCLFHGNPPPKITWRFGVLTIDGNAGRYRLMSDDALQIVSLYRNDTGIYICVADNGLGVATQEVNLVVNSPVKMNVSIAGDENAMVIGELGRPLRVRCLAYGYPFPSVFWYYDYDSTLVPYNDEVYEIRGNVLLIRSLALKTLGPYTCQAYNGEGKAASWTVIVRRNASLDSVVAPSPSTTPLASMTTTTSTTEAFPSFFTVPVSARILSPTSTLNSGNDLRLKCEVDGFPEPDVYWTKDGAIIRTDDRIAITAGTGVTRLTVTHATVADSGRYACHAINPHSSNSDTAQIKVKQPVAVPATCTDHKYFADCALIVRSRFCSHNYYSHFCCKSCVEAGQIDVKDARL